MTTPYFGEQKPEATLGAYFKAQAEGLDSPNGDFLPCSLEGYLRKEEAERRSFGTLIEPRSERSNVLVVWNGKAQWYVDEVFYRLEGVDGWTRGACADVVEGSLAAARAHVVRRDGPRRGTPGSPPPCGEAQKKNIAGMSDPEASPHRSQGRCGRHPGRRVTPRPARLRGVAGQPRSLTMSLLHRFTASTLALLLAGGAPACGGAPSDLEDSREAEARAGSALVDKKAALLSAINATIKNNLNVRGKFAQAVTAKLPVAPIISVVGNHFQVAIPVTEVVKEPLVMSAIVAAAGGVLTTSDVTAMAPDAKLLASLKKVVYENILTQYEYAGMVPTYHPVVLEDISGLYNELFEMGATDLFGVDDVLILGAALAGAATGAAIGYALFGDFDGDGTANYEDKAPRDPNKSFRFPPWKEGGSIYVPVAYNAQEALDLTGMLMAKLTQPGALAIDPQVANNRIQAAPGPFVTFVGGAQARLAFLP